MNDDQPAIGRRLRIDLDHLYPCRNRGSDGSQRIFGGDSPEAAMSNGQDGRIVARAEREDIARAGGILGGG